MVNPDRSMPDWVNKWLMINSAILIMDGSFCVLRPHSLPGGCMGTVYYGYKWYIQADKHYADPTDSFIFTQGLGNLIEASVCLLVLFNAFKTVRLNKMVTIFVSVMTAYKTILFCVYSLDIGQGGRAFEGLVAEFLVFGLGSVWLFVPAYVAWVLMQDFVDIKPKGTCSRYTPSKADDSAGASGRNTPSKADDSVDGTGNHRYNLRNLKR
ncbi:uncharacterized protein LOC123557533 [Mercenaria mercenaria]|uniref:uncharacterized protein LOC123557533 n=1 Tax=Mercenaria mercenaria TaxID=6596 RepID=UPI00234EA9D6|nr:uncharacterized protein LOC123557533 [Mercenaria mercenaria]